MAPMPLNDALFLLAESREHPMHVGSLQLFDLPPDVDPDYLGDLYQQSLEVDDIHRLYRKRAQRSLANLGQWGWVQERDLDLEYHVRHSALPRPGRIRELLALTSRLHGTLLDRNRPLWEFHLIEGLDEPGFAVYTKMHHAVVDGVAGLRLIADSLSVDPDARDVGPPWEYRKRAADEVEADGASASAPNPFSMASGVAHTVGEVAGVVPAVLRTARRAMEEQLSAYPFQAPPSLFNVGITGARRFAAESWPLERVKAVGKATGGTLNDAVLAMCSGALRQYLLELGALPDKALVAMVPVALRTSDQAGGGGNAVGSILCSLATDVADPAERMAAIQESTRLGKANLSGLSPLQVLALSAVVMAPMALGPLYRLRENLRPPFNVTISNIPGPRQPRYWNGARLRGIYPLSIPTDGQALNITCTSYTGDLEFGITGCRRRVPHLQRLLGQLEDSLVELEKAVGVA